MVQLFVSLSSEEVADGNVPFGIRYVHGAVGDFSLEAVGEEYGNFIRGAMSSFRKLSKSAFSLQLTDIHFQPGLPARDIKCKTCEMRYEGKVKRL